MAALLITFSLPAFAGDLAGERSYVDSFGNLVIHDPSGFKRILVGRGQPVEGHARRKIREPKVVYLEEDRGRLYLRERANCRYGALLQGRSYMYGLPDGVVPVPTVACR
ncbi:hypothetical protein [Chelativorans sp. AA-79]|uniref:hypothetical protein n=1 Tax=Chelativorans sp. AA-79 TaxID=3028735 RepID=UPI0023F88A4C|nr:hypothetical protein [Chelativorans sp. AA-79]WEX09947.1 hypothetical protein PVE73_02975 [Chelativorans sp. AA-79]